MHLMLLSNSTMYGEPYLAWALPHLRSFLAGLDEALFIPYAAVDIPCDEYTARVSAALPEVSVTGIHTCDDKHDAITRAQAIIVGGGNTFSLLCRCQEEGLLPPIRDAVNRGARYAGWSAGANLACPTIMTTNDMPIETPHGFDALGLVPFQINPHFTSRTIPGHGGESRARRITEYLHRNPKSTVIGLPEGTLLKVRADSTTLQGTGDAILFQHNHEPRPLLPGPINV